MKVSDLGRHSPSICAVAAILAGCSGSPSPTPLPPNSTGEVRSAAPERAEPSGKLKGHLYVASLDGTVERFQIVNGIPRSTPDRSYSGSPPIAIDSHGYLYAAGSVWCGSYFAPGVVVYSARSTTPVKTIGLESSRFSNQSVYIGSLLVDHQGYLYVGFTVTQLESLGASWAVNVYAPGASGCYGLGGAAFDQGSSSLCYRDGCYTIAGLAMDAQENVHVSNNTSAYAYGPLVNSVLSFASPTQDPQQIADLTGRRIVNPAGLAVGASNELYVDNAGLGPSSFISVYPASANGSHKPERRIEVAGAQSFGSGIAVAAGRVIIPDPAANVVYAVRAHKNGMQSPLWTLPLSSGFSPQDVKVGP